MAIVHVSFKSSSKAPPASAHAQYIAREGQYQGRGGIELVEHGNMPEFAQADPHAFWMAADMHERANGRTYTELQFALPRELDPAQRNELAREATRELLEERFAYTMAVHTPLAKDNIEQPHMHLMFSERIIDERTRSIPQEQFFKRNGAKKDRDAWHDQSKPEEVRVKWVEMMNGAMERAGIEHRLDPRSWAEQGREDLAALREQKTLQGNGPEAMERHEQIAELRRQREELPAPHLSPVAAAEQIDREVTRAVAEVEQRRDHELSLIDRLIEKTRELAIEVKERTVAVAQNVADRVEQLRGRFERWREPQVDVKPERNLDTQRLSRTQEKQEHERAGPELTASPEIEQKLKAFRERYEANKLAREPAVVPEAPVKEVALEKKQEPELKIEHSRGFGHGL